jgi:hypothetical protein
MPTKSVVNRSQYLASFRFSGKNIDTVSFEKRRVLNLLPSINQTETLQKFFNASADHLFEPAKNISLNGYIGRSIDYTEESETNFYVKESNVQRQFYQLEPTMVSVDTDGNTQSTLFYEDLINSIRFQGGITNNHNRLFSQNYFSWCPNIDLDKFMNFREYCWIPEGPTAIEIRGHAANYTGDGVTRVFSVTTQVATPSSSNWVKVTVDNVEVEFTYNSTTGKVKLNYSPASNAEIKVFTAVSIMNDVVGNSTFSFINDLDLASNQRIIIKNDKDQSLIDKIYIVEGVGKEILLISDDNPDLSISTDYILMQRGASDLNPWSVQNRWFHKSVITDLDKDTIKELQATRPIIEFTRNMQLYAFGTTRRSDVHLVSHAGADFLSFINGQTSSTRRIDGVIITKDWIQEYGSNNAIRVLVTSDDNSKVKNRIYTITFNSVTGTLKATLSADGNDTSGAPTLGESVKVLYGVSLGNKIVYWDGNDWVISQTKSNVNQHPLFKLYDANEVELDDPTVYPNSTFAGCRVFGYRENADTTASIDSVLNLRLVYNNSGEYEFENYLGNFSGTYRVGVDTLDLPTKKTYNIVENNTNNYLNDWYLVSSKSRQMVVDTFVAKNTYRLFEMSQAPVDPISENMILYRNNVKQEDGIDYIRNNNQFVMVDLEDGDILEAYTYNPANKPLNTTGQYEIPLNLEANPKWEQVSYASKGDLFEQFITIIRSQTGFSGLEYSSNNWKDLNHDLSLGRSIVSHQAPLLRTMLLNANDNINFGKSISYAMDEYARFRGKFDQKIKEYMINSRISQDVGADTWVDRVLEEIVRGYTPDFPFYYSKMAIKNDANHYFIPPTPSFLGIYPIQKPYILTKPVSGEQFIIGHDGSTFPVYGDFRDDVTLQLEQRIYDSTPDYVKEKKTGFFDFNSLISNKFYQAEYSIAEFNLILRPLFEKWSVNFGVDYKTNDTFDINDPFTWNWRSSVDFDNKLLPGHWRGIYRYYYGTENPHTSPWEMLGFYFKPDWWDSQYGVAPYGSGNVLMWRDIQNGVIADGDTAGTYANLAKPGLLNRLPVDSQGNLLDPVSARITATQPRSVKIEDDWIWGDGASAESAWKQSFWYPFALAKAAYLMKPALFVETTWDIERNLEEYSNIGYGYPYEEEYVHSETLYDGTINYVTGSQQWVVDYLKSTNKDVTTNLGDLIRGLDVKLAYKIGGFTNKDSLFVVSDNIDRIPSEDYEIQLYRSPSIREEFLSGVMFEKLDLGWKIYGYDILDPVFNIIPSDPTSRSVSISLTPSQKLRIPTWKQHTYYPQNTTVRYIDKYYRAIISHTSIGSFETKYWVQVTRPTYADTHAVEYFLEPKNKDYVERIPYGTIFKSIQEVATFISGYERYLESRGWLFDTVLTSDSDIYNWRKALKDFLSWTQDSTVTVGTMFAIIPDSARVHFATEHGNIESIEQIVNGVYSILDSSGNPIKTYNTNVVRNDGEVEITTRNNQSIYAVRLHISEIEHILIVNNTTIFDDVVYSPLFDIRQARLRLQGFKTMFWKGRIDAPGFIVTDTALIPNFEKTADDFRRLFDIETIEDTELKERARSNYGYIEKEYFNNLLVTSTNQYEFYQGMIQQKGTVSAMRKLFRNTFIHYNDGLDVLEEWAFRVGEYGATDNNQSLDLLIDQSDFKNSPQMFEFLGNGQGGWDMLSWDDDHYDYIKSIETSTVNISLNGIGSVSIDQAGAGYTEIPTVTLTDDDTGSKFKATIDWKDSGISSIDVITRGSGYFVGDQVEFEGTGQGAVAKVSIVDYSGSKLLKAFVIPAYQSTGAGSSYAVGDQIRFLNGNGLGTASVASVTSTGGILTLTVTKQGSSYDGTLTDISWPNSNNSAADKIGIKVTGGRIIHIEVEEAGSGYDNTTVISSIGNGSGFVGNVNITGGSIGRIDVVNSGSGFEANQTLTITGGGSPTTVATATAIVDSTGLNSPYLIMGLKTPDGAIIKSITIKVTDEFSGIQPILTIGDEDENARYIDNIDLGKRFSKTYDMTANGDISNSTNYIYAYITNAQDAGHVEIITVFEFTPNYYLDLFTSTQDDKSIKVIDLFDNETNGFMYKDSRWVWRHNSKTPDWPLIEVEQKRKGNLPSAGYVSLNDVKWTARYNGQLNTLFSTKKAANPATEITNTVDVEYKIGNSSTRRKQLIPNLNKGLYRIKNFVVDITEGFPLTSDDNLEVEISIGTIDNPELYLESTVVETDLVQTYDHIIYQFYENSQDNSNAIYLFITQNSGLAIAPGAMSVTANIELINDQVIPGDRAWIYNTGYGDWDVKRFGDTNLNVEFTKVPSYDGQGTVIATDANIFEALSIDHNYQQPDPDNLELNETFQDDIDQAEARLSHIILDEIMPDTDTTSMLTDNYSAKVQNSVRFYIDANEMLQNNGDSLIQLPIMDMWASTGLVINKITASVVRPFTYPSGYNPLLTIGTQTDRNRFLGAVESSTANKSVKTAPTRPTFSYSAPITVNVYDDSIVLNEQDASASVRLIRTGNIYVTPSSIDITNGGWGYSSTSSPKVTVTGPTGVKATANMVGTIVGYEVTSPGSDYTSTPTVTIIGGSGTGAEGTAVIKNGKLKSVSLPGKGTGTSATAVINGGKITSISVTGGSGWEMTPIITFKGGSPDEHAVATAIVTDGVITSITIDHPGSGYQEAPEVIFNPTTGDGYTSEPRVVISGGGGSGATVEPIMIWSVGSIEISDLGKCSWTGSDASVNIRAPKNGGPAQAVLVSSPTTLEPTVIQQWRYRMTEPEEEVNSNVWIYVDTPISFPAPTGTNGPDYWKQTISLPFNSIDETTTYEIEIPEYVIDTATGEATETLNVTNGELGTVTTSTVTIHNTVKGSRDINLRVGKRYGPFYINEQIDEDDQLVAYYNSDGVSEGYVTIVIDYHYTNGFELFGINSKTDTPVVSSITGTGGDIFAWNSVRFSDNEDLELPERLPVGGWQVGDIVMLDDGRNKTEKAVLYSTNTHYAYHQMVKYNGITYRSILGGTGLTATVAPLSNGTGKLDYPVITDKGTLYTYDPAATITGDGTNAEAAVHLAGTGVYKILVLNSTSNYGYTGTEVIKITPKYSSGTGATARVGKVENGVIKEIVVTNSGWGYDAAPIVEIVDDPGITPVQLQVVLIPAQVKNIELVNRGENYTTAAITFTNTDNTLTEFKAVEWEALSEAESGWRVLEYTDDSSDPWQEIRRETAKIDSDLIDSAVIYDLNTGETLQTLQLYDPYKGYIFASAKRELSYILEYDPAIYSNGPLAKSETSAEKLWDSAKVGDVWWDISAIRYLDYEIDDISYKWKNWGKRAPGSKIFVYEWTRSTVPPSQWATLVSANRNETDSTKPTGTVRNILGSPSWVEKQEYNKETGLTETAYYFWVKNATTLPGRVDRKLTVKQITNLISRPFEQDIPWYAVIDYNKVIVGGVKSYLNNSTSLKISWKKDKLDTNIHKEWRILRDGDERNTIDESLWNKMRDSLVGWDNNTTSKTNTTYLTTSVIPSATSLVVNDTTGFELNGELKIGNYWIKYDYINGNEFVGIDGLGDMTFAAGTKVTQTRTVESFNQVPNQWLNERERYGNLNRPAQTWFKTDTDSYGFLSPGRDARKAFVETMNEIFATEPFLDTRYEWQEIFTAEEAEPLETEYSFAVTSMAELQNLVEVGSIVTGQKVLLSGIDDTNGLWTLWCYLPDEPTANEYGYILVKAQRYRLREGELWTAVDWYNGEWTTADYPVKRYATILERDLDAANNLDETLLRGTLVRVDSQSATDTRWAWYVKKNNTWEMVAKEKATIQLNSDFYDDDKIVYGFDSYQVANSKNRDGSWELQYLINSIKAMLLTSLERNQLFFSMVKTAISQHNNTDWIFKTSFLYIAGYDEALTQSPIVIQDQVDEIINYLNDVKPYHVKIRDYVRRLVPEMELVNLNVTDFDKPLYFDTNTNEYRKLDVTNSVDAYIMANDSIYKWWYNNYQKTNYDLSNWDSNWNPIRRPKITMLYDRVSCNAISGWDQLELPWDGNEQRWVGNTYTKTFAELSELYRVNNTTYNEFVFADITARDEYILKSQIAVNSGEDALVNKGDLALVTSTTNKTIGTFMWSGSAWVQFFNIQWDTNQIGGLADRIENYYEPTSTMRRKELDTLIKGCDFKGTIVDGGGTPGFGLWDMFAWDVNTGWDNEYDYYIGYDLNINPVSSGLFDEDPSSDDILIDGAELDQPWFEGGHPDERATIKIRDPLMITVYRSATASGNNPTVQPNAFRFFKDSINRWEGVFLEEDGITLAQELNSADNTVTIQQTGTFTLFDPTYATNNIKTSAEVSEYRTMLKEQIALKVNLDLSTDITVLQIKNNDLLKSFGFNEILEGLSDTDIVNTQIETRIDEIIASYTDGVIWIGSERITYSGVIDNGDSTYTLTGAVRGSAGTSRKLNYPVGTAVYDGSILNALDSYNSSNMRAYSVIDYNRNWSSWIESANKVGINAGPVPQ